MSCGSSVRTARMGCWRRSLRLRRRATPTSWSSGSSPAARATASISPTCWLEWAVYGGRRAFLRWIRPKYRASDWCTRHSRWSRPKCPSAVCGGRGTARARRPVDRRRRWRLLDLEAIEDYRPRVVVVEYNSALDPRRRLVQPPIMGRLGRHRLLRRVAGAMRALGERQGLSPGPHRALGVNAFLVATISPGAAFPPKGSRCGHAELLPAGIRHPPDPDRGASSISTRAAGRRAARERQRSADRVRGATGRSRASRVSGRRASARGSDRSR